MTGDAAVPDGHEVKRLRHSRGWTQEDVARRIQDRAGSFSKRTLQSIEAGRPAHLRSVRLVAEALEVDVSRLLVGTGSAPHDLPSARTSFIGRAREIEEIHHHLDDHRVVTLTGPGGSGKSRLAIEVARGLLGDADGVHLVELAAVPSAELVPVAVARALGVGDEPGRPIEEVIVDAIRPRTLLVVVDNCEHLVGASAAIVSHLVSACPGVRVLATSREALHIAGELIYPVPPLALPDRAASEPDAIAPVASVALLVDRASAVRPGFALTRANAAAVTAVCHHLDGIPLALELAAARVRTLSVEEIAERLSDRFGLLTDGPRDLDARHRTLRGLIDWSHALLTSDERALFRRLAVFAGGWSLDAAEQVCAGPELAAADVLDLLSSLVGKSLVTVDPDRADPDAASRYRFLESIRDYARERLDTEEDDADAVRMRHRDVFVALAEEIGPELDGPEPEHARARLADEHDNLRLGLDHAVRGDGRAVEAGLRMAAALGLFWRSTGLPREGRATCLALLDRADDAAPILRARVLHVAGMLDLELGEATEAASLLEESLAIARAGDDESLVASVLNDLGTSATRRGEFDHARGHHQESLDIRSRLGDERGVANCLMNLGVLARRQGDHPAARRLFEKSLALRRGLGDRRGIAMTLANLGNLAYSRHRYPEAQSLLSEALAMFEALADRRSAANALNNLGNVARRRGDVEGARRRFEDALATARELGDRRSVALGLQNLGNVALDHEDHGTARVHYEESLALNRSIGNRQGAAHLVLNLAIAARREGLLDEARSRAEESLGVCRELQDRPGVGEAIAELHHLAWRAGDVDRAERLAEESLTLHLDLGHLGGILDAVIGLGCVAAHRGREEPAARLLSAGRALIAGNGLELDRWSTARLENAMASVRTRVGDEAWVKACAAGERLSVEEAANLALGG